VLIKDNRSPRGRLEEQPRQGDALRGLRSYLPPMMEGFTWANTSRAWLRRPDINTNRPKAVASWKRTMVQVVLECEDCGDPFLARQKSLARYCSDRCRKRASRARLVA